MTPTMVCDASSSCRVLPSTPGSPPKRRIQAPWLIITGRPLAERSSSSVKEPISNLGLSTVLRASVSALAKTLALELAAANIRVNQIVPGRIDTDRVRQLDGINAKKQGITVDQAKAKAVANIPLGRYGETDEFGRVAAFLLSDAASYMTGATVQVDGGLIRSVV